MQKNLGGDRIGSGAKIKVDLSGFGRSTFNQSRVWKSTAGVGMLIPCFMELGTNGTTFDIDINTMGHTIPTIGPLFDGYKLQVDLFACPIRLYQGILHNNAYDLGLKMDQVLLPTIKLGDGTKKSATNPSSLLNYLGIKGYHSKKNTFNAVPILAYYDIFKNYYSNKQEDEAKVLGWKNWKNKPITAASMLTSSNNGGFMIFKGSLRDNEENQYLPVTAMMQSGTRVENGFSFNNPFTATGATTLTINFEEQDVNTDTIKLRIVSSIGNLIVTDQVISKPEIAIKRYAIYKFNGTTKGDMVGYMFKLSDTSVQVRFFGNFDEEIGSISGIVFSNKVSTYEIYNFNLSNIDDARREILAKTTLGQRIAMNSEQEDINYLPYSLNFENDEINYLEKDFQGLCLKTYQSDIFNNWLNTDNVNLINEIASIGISTNDNMEQVITMDSLILAKKVYNVLNRIAVSGGTYEDWQESIWGQKAIRRAESPIYIGGTSAQIQFEEVVSTAQTQVEDVYQPLGNLGGKGAMINKQGGSIIYKCEEPTIIIGIASITPYVNYSQGNNWIVTNLNSMNDLHKPELDGIAFQNLIENNVHWEGSPNVAVAKQTAWINYQTAINECYGQFAIPKGEENSLYFMTLQRDYEVNEIGEIKDFTTYIDPSKYNYAFADNRLTAQNFWLQIGFNVQSRRVMAAYQIPNL